MVYVPPLALEFSASECAWYASLSLAVMAPITLYSEFSGQNCGYSKFTSVGPDKSVPIPTIAGMFCLYFVPMLVALAVHWSEPPTTAYASLVVLNVAAHFAKRISEVLFLHKYSGNMNLMTTFMIMMVYCLHSFANCYTAKYDMPQEHQPSNLQAQLGFALFWSGELGTMYYHRILADLRRPGEKRYRVPTGGMFEYVCCPHYVFELMVFAGLAIMSNHAVGWTTVVSMAGYLLGRSAATLRWYQERAQTFDRQLPRRWRAMIPGVW